LKLFFGKDENQEILNSRYLLEEQLRAGIFIIGAALLVLGIFLVADYYRRS